MIKGNKVTGAKRYDYADVEVSGGDVVVIAFDGFYRDKAGASLTPMQARSLAQAIINAADKAERNGTKTATPDHTVNSTVNSENALDGESEKT